MLRQHPTIPLALCGQRGQWSVIEPIASTNLLTNPSAETNTSGHTTIAGGAISRTNTQNRYGQWAFQYTPAANVVDGHRTNSVVLTAGQVYTFSVDCKMRGIPYALEVTTQAGVLVKISPTFYGSGTWRRHALTLIPSTSGNHYLRVRKVNSASVVPFYTDGWQLEPLPYATTYIDGDQRGFPTDYYDHFSGQAKASPYQWLGTPHASQSRRLATTRHGGRVRSFEELGLTVLSYSGEGLVPVNVHDITFGSIGGGAWQRTTRSIRTIGIAVQMFSAFLAPDIATAQRLLAPNEPLMLQFQRTVDGPTVDVPVVYESGFEGETMNLYEKTMALQYRNYLPIVERPTLGTALNYSQSITNANYALHREYGKGWKTLSGLSEEIRAMVYNPADNAIYLGGAVQGLYRWDGTTLTALAVLPALTDFQGLTVDPAGFVYAATTNGTVYRYNPATNTYTDLVAGMTAANAALYAPDGYLYIGGRDAGNRGVVRRYNGATWSTIIWTNVAANATIRTLAWQFRYLYFGGLFTSANSATTTGAVVNNIGSWQLAPTAQIGSLGIGTDDQVNALFVLPNGYLIAGGKFSFIGGLGSHIAIWNDYQWTIPGAGLSYEVKAIAVQRDGVIYAGGVSTVAGIPDNVNMFASGTWQPLDVDLPGTGTTINAIAISGDGSLTLGYSTAGTAKSAVTPVVNSANADASPIFTFYGPGTIGQLTNYTTQQAIYFKDLTLLDGEIATLDLTPGAQSFTSSTRGNLMPYVGAGSDLFLTIQPGTNYISSFLYGTTSANTAIYERHRVTYTSLDEVR